MEEVVKGLLDIIKQQNEVILELTRLSKEQAPALLPEPSPIPLYTTETEEDARAAYAAGVIDRHQLDDALAEIGFYSSEIVVPTAGTDL